MRVEEFKDHPLFQLVCSFIKTCNNNPLFPFEFAFEVDPSISLEHDERTILVMNHSGYLGFEPLFLFAMCDTMEETHDYFQDVDFQIIVDPLFKMVLDIIFPAEMFISASDVRKILDGPEMLLLFPEGVEGVCKSGFTNGYNCQEFKRGFLHLAKQQKRNILVTTVVGHEEAFTSLGKFTFTLMDQTLDLPSPLLPPFVGMLGNKYKIKIHEKISHEDVDTSCECAATVRSKVQQYLDEESKHYILREISKHFDNMECFFQIKFSM